MISKNQMLLAASSALVLAFGVSCSQEGSSKPNTNQIAAAEAPKQDSNHTIAQSDTISQTDVLKLSEAFGHFLGRNLKVPGFEFDLDSIVKGIRAGYAGLPAPMNDADYEQLMTKVQTQAFATLSGKNLKEANEFLAKNAKADKVVEIEPLKLQYIVLQEGQGAPVAEHASPQVKYSGKFLDGTAFGSSDDAGGTLTIPLDQIIPGFNKGVVGMKEGEKRRLFIHPDLGYGTMGHLPPNSLLIFEVEVVKANAPEADQDDEGDEDGDDLPDLSLTDEDSEEENS